MICTQSFIVQMFFGDQLYSKALGIRGSLHGDVESETCIHLRLAPRLKMEGPISFLCE